MAYSGSSELGLNKKGIKYFEKEKYTLSKIVMAKGAGCHRSSNLVGVFQGQPRFCPVSMISATQETK